MLIDEADVWVDRDRINNWRLFGKLRGLSHDQRMRVVLAGEHKLLRTISGKEGPLGNFGTTIQLGPLDENAVRLLVTVPFELLDVELINGEKIIDQINGVTGGHPSMVQRLCRRLVDFMNQQRTRQLTLDTVNEVSKSRDFLKDDFRVVFLERITALELVITILMMQSPELLELENIRQALRNTIGHAIPKEEVEDAVDRLVKLRSILVPEDSSGHYRFSCPATLPNVVRYFATSEDLLVAVARYSKELNRALPRSV